MTARRAWGLWLLYITGQSCAGTAVPDLERLALLPPLPHRVVLSGGAILDVEQRDAPGEGVGSPSVLSDKTYPKGIAEPISFARLEDVLRRARVASRLIVFRDMKPPAREAVAISAAKDQQDQKAAFERMRNRAEEDDADLLLVIEGLRDAPVVDLGRNGQWPVSSIAWLLVGLGMFIPDHRFESSVALSASLWDVHSGSRIARVRVSPGSVDLSLLERTDFLGILESIIIPPTLVGSSSEEVVEHVRHESDRRLLLGLAARLKAPEMRQRLLNNLSGLALTELQNHRVLVQTESPQEVQSIAVQIDGATWEDSRVDVFRKSFFASERRLSRRDFLLDYRAQIVVPEHVSEFRVILQTVAGQKASTTIELEKLR
ncbi:MAG: hypothetical protein ACE5F1_04065 [Planctomycetota bacterium]